LILLVQFFIQNATISELGLVSRESCFSLEVKGFKGSKVESIWLKESLKLSLSMKARWTTPGQVGRLEGREVGRSRGREVERLRGWWKSEKVER